MTEKTRFRFDDLIVDPEEQYPVSLDCYEIAVAKWTPNEMIASSEYCRPTIPNGFAYQADSPGGTSGTREPRWPLEVGLQVPDGSLTWTCVVAESNGISPITLIGAYSEPGGLTLSDVSVDENRKLLATYEGATLGGQYEAIYTFSIDGLTRIARQRVICKKQ